MNVLNSNLTTTPQSQPQPSGTYRAERVAFMARFRVGARVVVAGFGLGTINSIGGNCAMVAFDIDNCAMVAFDIDKGAGERVALFETIESPSSANQPRHICPRCNGSGEVVVASHDVGDGCFNDDFDRCPACKGAGHV